MRVFQAWIVNSKKTQLLLRKFDCNMCPMLQNNLKVIHSSDGQSWLYLLGCMGTRVRHYVFKTLPGRNVYFCAFLNIFRSHLFHHLNQFAPLHCLFFLPFFCSANEKYLESAAAGEQIYLSLSRSIFNNLLQFTVLSHDHFVFTITF